MRNSLRALGIVRRAAAENARDNQARWEANAALESTHWTQIGGTSGGQTLDAGEVRRRLIRHAASEFTQKRRMARKLAVWAELVSIAVGAEQRLSDAEVEAILLGWAIEKGVRP